MTTLKEKRIPLGKKIRFEVLKRDSFKCKYCGKAAEEVPLHVDHIHPVAMGGTNEIMNLVTACEACNLGKKAIPLDDRTVAIKARKQAETLQDQKEVLEMMATWRAGLRDLQGQSVDHLVAHWTDSTTGSTLNEGGKAELKKLLKRYTFDEIIEAMDKAISQYLKFNEDGQCTHESFEEAYAKIKPILKWQSEFKKDPELEDLLYIRGIARKRCPSYFPDRDAMEKLKLARANGVSISDLKQAALSARSYTSFVDAIENAGAKSESKPLPASVSRDSSEDPEIEERKWSTDEGDHHFGNTLSFSKQMIEGRDIAEIKVSNSWICDSCGELISFADEGRLIQRWDNGTAYISIVHKSDENCTKSEHEDLGSLTRYTGSYGIMEFASMLQSDDFSKRSLAEAMKRCLVPGYELPHYHFAFALKEKIVDQYLAEGCFFEFQLDRILAWLGAIGGCITSPQGSSESKTALPNPSGKAYEFDPREMIRDSDAVSYQNHQLWEEIHEETKRIIERYSAEDLIKMKAWYCDKCGCLMTDSQVASIATYLDENERLNAGIIHTGPHCSFEPVIKDRDYKIVGDLADALNPHVIAKVFIALAGVEEISVKTFFSRINTPGFEIARFHLFRLRDIFHDFDENSPKVEQVTRAFEWLKANSERLATV